MEIEYNGINLNATLTTTSKNSSAAALLLHGGPGGSQDGPSDLFIKLADRLAHAGITSLRFDFLGQGASGGNYEQTSATDQVAQYRLMYEILRGHGYDRIGVVGESFGATCALSGYRTGEVQALALLWPAIWLLDTTFTEFLGRPTPFEWDGDMIGDRFISDLTSHPDREQELIDVSCPTLLIHGTADSEVPVAQARKAYELLTEPKRVIIVDGADHCLREPSEQEVTLSETTQWLKQYLL